MAVIDGLNTVEIEVNSHCNRRCSYCPNSLIAVTQDPQYMEDAVVNRLLQELVRIDFCGRISYHFYNEPLLREDLENIVTKFRQQLPNCNQVLFTNGDLLDDTRYNRLLVAGIDLFQVTSHSGRDLPSRAQQSVYFACQLTLTNRGGTLTSLPGPTDAILRTPCNAPSEMLIITVNGDVLLCYEDAGRKYSMGNILQQSLEEIWYSEEFERIRKATAEGRRESASVICRLCTNVAHTIPGTSHIPSL